MAVTNRYVWGPNLVGGTPMSPHPKGMSYVLGAAPHSRWASKHPRDSSEKSTKSHSGPLQPRPTHTPSRRCAPCSLASFHFFFRELPLLSRPRPAQPLLLTADSAGSSVFLSPISVTIAAARPCMFIESVSAKNACPACALGARSSSRRVRRCVWNSLTLSGSGGDATKPSISNFRFRPCLCHLELKPAHGNALYRSTVLKRYTAQ